jgi:hypothetical protein
MVLPHQVIMRFTLLPALLLHAPIGRWGKTPRGVDLVVERDGAVTITGHDHLETYAVQQVLRCAARFLKSLDRDTAARAIAATLESPSTRRGMLRAPDRYAIALDAEVSIARTDRAPAVFGAGGEQELNQAAS